MAKSSAVLATILLLGSTVTYAGQAAPTARGQVPRGPDKTTRPAPPITLVTAPPQSPPPPPSTTPTTPTTSGRRIVVTEDGSVETALPDGSRRITRPNACGFTTIFPDGRASRFSCSTQVPKATPPLPDPISSEWLNAHSEGLLDLARRLLGDDQVSIDNYLRNYENPQQTVYDRIRIRTSFLFDLSGSD